MSQSELGNKQAGTRTLTKSHLHVRHKLYIQSLGSCNIFLTDPGKFFVRDYETFPLTMRVRPGNANSNLHGNIIQTH